MASYQWFSTIMLQQIGMLQMVCRSAVGVWRKGSVMPLRDVSFPPEVQCALSVVKNTNVIPWQFYRLDTGPWDKNVEHCCPIEILENDGKIEKGLACLGSRIRQQGIWGKQELVENWSKNGYAQIFCWFDNLLPPWLIYQWAQCPEFNPTCHTWCFSIFSLLLCFF